ncbi:MAG: beta-xylosidase [Bauldia sp.]
MPDTIAVAVTVHADRSTGAYRPLWNWFGYDEPNYTYTANGRKLLAELRDLSPEPVRLRTHNLLTSGDGKHALKWGSTNAYREDAAGNPVYDWTIIDRIFDAYVEAGAIPLVQVGFTPEALSDAPGPYRHTWSPTDKYGTITTGWAAPPNDLQKWGDLVEAWAAHLAGRYGQALVESWPWEVWNEPDGYYWTGTIPEFCAMYDVTAAAIKRVLPGARVGGPHTCGAAENEKAAAFLREFLRHCVHGRNAVTGAIGSPLDFVGFHAKGNPSLHNGHVRMGVQRQLRDIASGLAIMAEFPELDGKPVILGESDPEGCAACSARVHPQNAYRNGPLYGVYTVEQIIRTYELARRAGVTIEGSVTWAFLFEDQPYFEGFRDLATNGIDKPVLNAFRMLGMLGGSWLEAVTSQCLTLDEVMLSGVRAGPDVNVAATRDETGVSVLLWHYHDDDAPGAKADIALTVDGLPGNAASLRHYRMDAGHSNAYAVWQEMGAPQTISEEAYRRLEDAGKLALLEEAAGEAIKGGTIRRTIQLPRQGVSLIRLVW